MKSQEEIQRMLLKELHSFLSGHKEIEPDSVYFNEQLGNTSSLLAALLDSILRAEVGDWQPHQWMDDSLLTSVQMQNNTLTISGIMIWGAGHHTEQWTEPFCFRIQPDADDAGAYRYTFLFSDLDHAEVSYTKFNQKRSVWDIGTEDRDVCERNWRYIINKRIQGQA